MAREFPNPKLDSSASESPFFAFSSFATDSSASRDDMSESESESEDCLSDEQRQEKAQSCLARMVCCERVSPKTWCDENISFRQLMDAANPYLNFPFVSLEKNCLELFAQEREKVKRTFSKFSGNISLSVDVLIYEKQQWGALDWYMCLCTHFIDDDWKLRKWVIKYCGVHGEDHDHPITAILKSVEEWGIKSKISTITVREMANLVVEEIQEGIQEGRDLPLNGQLFHVQCCSDVITRIVEEGFKEISEIISKVQFLCWSKSDPLWYLTSSNLRYALELNSKGKLSSKFVSKNERPSKGEWGKVRRICRIADRIYEIVKGLFEVKRPTSNLFLPHLLEIHTFLTQELASLNVFESTVARKMLKIFNGYLNDMFLVLAIAAFMDPRYKMEFISFSSSKLEVGDGNFTPTFVLETIRKLYEGYGAVENNENEHFSSESSCEYESEDEEEGSSKRARKQERKLLEGLNILKEYRGSVQPMNDESIKSDLDIYLEEPILTQNEDFNVLLWWKDNRSKYPRLSRMARDFLAIPFSIATSHGAYNIEPREADKTVVSLKPDLMNALMCTRSWNLSPKSK